MSKLDDASESLSWALEEIQTAAQQAGPVESLVLLPLVSQVADVLATVDALRRAVS